MAKKQVSTGCCPPFNPKPWENKTVTWKNKRFVFDTVPCFFYIPLGMDGKMGKIMSLINSAGADNPEQIMLMDCSLFSTDVYIAVNKEVPGAQMKTISGTFLSRVFEGPYSNSGKWAKEMEEYVKKKGKKMEKLYFSYTTCPNCSKAYGKNYVVLFAKI